MIGDLLAHVLGEAAFGRLSGSPRARLVARLFFGCLGAALSVVGLVYLARQPRTANMPMHLSMLAMFACFGAFWLCNVGLGRRWKWPAAGFVVSFVLMFITRIAFGR